MKEGFSLNLKSYESYQKQKSTLIPSQFTRSQLFEHSIIQITESIESEDNDYLSVIFDVFIDLMLALDEGLKNFESVKNYEKLLFALIRRSESTSMPCRKKAQNCFRNFLKLFNYEAQSRLIIHLIEQLYNGYLKVDMEPQVLAFLCDIYRQKFNESELKQMFGKHLADFYAQIQKFQFPDLMQATQFYSSVLLLIALQARTQYDLVLLKGRVQKLFDEINILVRDFIHLMELRKKSQQNSNEPNLHEIFPLEILKMHIVETSRFLRNNK